MTADPILTLAWLVLAHLVADFLLQGEAMVLAKRSSGWRALRGLTAHGLVVAGGLVPVALAFGEPGVRLMVAVFVSHVLIDRSKVVLTRRAEARALAGARARHEGPSPADHLGRAWTPAPAALFALDQVAHLAVLGAGWAIWLAGLAPIVEWTVTIDRLLEGWDRAVVHEVTLTAVVIVALLIANIRGAALFVGTLVRPAEAMDEAAGRPSFGVEAAERIAARSAAAETAVRPRGWSFRLGPLAGRVEADAEPVAVSTVPVGPHVPAARVGATIGILERLLIVSFILTGAAEAIGFVVAAKTIARFRLLEDRDFAEYYLLGTLASVSVALFTALIARAALDL